MNTAHVGPNPVHSLFKQAEVINQQARNRMHIAGRSSDLRERRPLLLYQTFLLRAVYVLITRYQTKAELRTFLVNERLSVLFASCCTCSHAVKSLKDSKNLRH